MIPQAIGPRCFPAVVNESVKTQASKHSWHGFGKRRVLHARLVTLEARLVVAAFLTALLCLCLCTRPGELDAPANSAPCWVGNISESPRCS